MNQNRTHRNAPSRHTEREARRLGWYPESQITWREFLEQYPLGLAEITGSRAGLEHAA